jgi:iron complex outermembrane receptor protein
VPRHQVKGRLDASWRALRTALFARWVSTRYVTVDASQGLDPYVVLDARMATSVDLASLDIECAVLLENVLNREYEVIRDYPMPPRRLTLQIHVSID